MLRIGLLLLCIPAVALMAGFMMEQSDIQACLASSGSWNYQESLCDLEAKHPFIPFMVRYPILVNGGMLLSVIGLFMTIIGLYKPSRVNRTE